MESTNKTIQHHTASCHVDIFTRLNKLDNENSCGRTSTNQSNNFEIKKFNSKIYT